jgi:DNA-directed RNA polymerase subunit RPC12/RpoP
MKLFNNLSWFKPKETEGVSVMIDKYTVIDMKDSNNPHEEKISKDLQHTPDVVDRRVVMLYEKKFRDKFTKLGNLHQRCPYCSKEYKSLHLGEKKCSECKHTFLVQKRVQDMGTAAFKIEQKRQFDSQWKAASDIKKFKFYLSNEYDYIANQLKKQGKKYIVESDVMHSLLNAYAKNSLSNGYYALYAAFLFHKAELMRSEQRFAEALVYYFYVYFLHTNGVDNQAGFKANYIINAELKERIADLLDLGDIQTTKAKDLFDYAVVHLNKFNPSSFSLSAHKSYSLLIKEFKLHDEAKQGVRPMRSFVLYTNKAS